MVHVNTAKGPGVHPPLLTTWFRWPVGEAMCHRKQCLKLLLGPTFLHASWLSNKQMPAEFFRDLVLGPVVWSPRFQTLEIMG